MLGSGWPASSHNALSKLKPAGLYMSDQSIEWTGLGWLFWCLMAVSHLRDAVDCIAKMHWAGQAIVYRHVNAVLPIGFPS